MPHKNDQKNVECTLIVIFCETSYKTEAAVTKWVKSAYDFALREGYKLKCLSPGNNKPTTAIIEHIQALAGLDSKFSSVLEETIEYGVKFK